jgi:hypothetical protein
VLPQPVGSLSQQVLNRIGIQALELNLLLSGHLREIHVERQGSEQVALFLFRRLLCIMSLAEQNALPALGRGRSRLV